MAYFFFGVYLYGKKAYFSYLLVNKAKTEHSIQVGQMFVDRHKQWLQENSHSPTLAHIYSQMSY